MLGRHGNGLPIIEAKKNTEPSVQTKATRRAGDALRQRADQIAAAISKEAQEKTFKSAFKGDVFKPWTWELPEDPSLEGLAHVTVDVLGSMAPVVIGALMTRSPTIAAGLGGSQSAGAAAEVAREEIAAAAQDVDSSGVSRLERESPYYRELVAAGHSPEDATEIVSEAAQKSAAAWAFIPGALGGAATGRILQHPLAALAKKKAAARIAGTAAVSAVEEGAQEVAETMATRQGIQEATGIKQDLTADTLNDFVMGALGGGPVGAIGGLRRAPQGPTAEPGEGAGVGPGAPREPDPAPGGGNRLPEPGGGKLLPPPAPSGPLGRAAALAADLPDAPRPLTPATLVDGSKVRLEIPGGVPIDAVFKEETDAGILVEADGSPFLVPRSDVEAGLVEIRPRDPITEQQDQGSAAPAAGQGPDLPGADTAESAAETSPYPPQTVFDVAMEIDHGIQRAVRSGNGMFGGLDVREPAIQDAIKSGADAALRGAQKAPVFPQPEQHEAALRGYEMARNRAETRLDAPPRGVPGAAASAAARNARPSRPRAPTLKKRPFTAAIKGIVRGIDPDGPVGQELRHRGVTPRTAPGLFRKGGARSLDNLPAEEWGDYAHIICEDGNGYLDENGIIEALAAEVAGAPVQDSEQTMLQADADARAELEELRAKGLEPDEAGLVDLPADVAETWNVVPPRDDLTDFDGAEQDRAAVIWRGIIETERDAGVALSASERQSVFARLDANGGNIEDAVWWQLEQEPKEDAQGQDQQAGQDDQGSGPPLFEPDLPGARRAEGSGAARPGDERPQRQPGDESAGAAADAKPARPASTARTPEGEVAPPGNRDDWWRSLPVARWMAKQVGLSREAVGDEAWNNKTRLVATVNQFIREMGYTDLLAPETSEIDQSGAKPDGQLPTEATPEGEQTLIPGVKPVTDKGRAEAEMKKPKRGGNAPADFGLFDINARNQGDLFGAPVDGPAPAATQGTSDGELPPTPTIENIRQRAAIIRGIPEDTPPRVPGVSIKWDARAGGFIFSRKHIDKVRTALGLDEASQGAHDGELSPPVLDDRLEQKKREAHEAGRNAAKAGQRRTPPAWMGEVLRDEWLAGYAEGIAALSDAEKIEQAAAETDPNPTPAQVEAQADTKPAVKKITQAEWDAKPDDYKTVHEDGTRSWMELDKETGATVSRPVEIVDEPTQADKPIITEDDFASYDEALDWANGRADELGMTWRAYTATPEYKEVVYPVLQVLHRKEEADHISDLVARMEKAGVKDGDRVEAHLSTGVPFENRRVTGTVFIGKNGAPMVRLDGEPVINGKVRKRPVRWSEMFRPIEAPQEAAPSGPRVIINEVGPDGPTDEERGGHYIDDAKIDRVANLFGGDFTADVLREEVAKYGWDKLAFAFKIDEGEGRHSYRWFDGTGKPIGTRGSKTLKLPPALRRGDFRDALTAYAEVKKGFDFGAVLRGEAATDQNPAKKPTTKKDEEKPSKPGLSGLTDEENAELAALEAELAAIIKGQVNSGLDPKLVEIAYKIGRLYIRAGRRQFVDFLKALMERAGLTFEQAQPVARNAYNQIRDDMALEGEDVSDMQSSEDVLQIVRDMRDTAKAEPAQEQAANSERTPDQGTPQAEADERASLTSLFAAKLADGEEFPTITRARKLAAERLGRNLTEADYKMIEEAFEAAIVRRAQAIAGSETDPAAAYGAMVRLYNQQPKLAQRTSTSIEQQAYSTPVPLAYLASRLAGINDRTRVYEPTAGNGMLLIEAAPHMVTANELNPDRFAQLRKALPGAKLTNADAMQIDTPAKSQDVVIANPPFGKVKDASGENVTFPMGDLTTTEIDHAIAFKALDAMKDDGKAVLLVGGHQGDATTRRDKYRRGMSRRFMKALYDTYNVTEHFTVDGKLYQRQGAGWPVDVIVIEGRKPSEKVYPMKEAPALYSDWSQLRERLDGTKDNLDPRGDRGLPGDGEAGTADGTADVRPVSVSSGSQDRPNGSSGTGMGGNGPRGTGGTADVGIRPAGAGIGGEPGGTPGLPFGDAQQQDNGAADLPGGPGADQGRPGSVVDHQGAKPDGVSGRPIQPAEHDGARDVAKKPRPKRENTEKETAYQVQYEPRSAARFAVGTLVPRNMQESVNRALDALQKRVGDIDDYVAGKLGYTRDELLGTDEKPGYFSAEQVDALALAIDNIEAGKGFIIGDQTGVGKGRINAGLIRYAIRHGKTPVFFTVKPGLYGDMIRDLRDIGEDRPEDYVYATNDDMRGEKAIPLSDDPRDKLFGFTKSKNKKARHDLISKGQLPIGKKVLFTTYSQMQSGTGKAWKERRDALMSIAPNAIFILDESHNAGGSASARPDPEKPAPVSEYMRRLLAASYNGVFFSSATFAKNPTVMSLYFKTNLSEAVDDMDNLSDIIDRGGVPLQQIISNSLVRDGQYLRRERTYDGIEMRLEQLPTDPLLTKDASGALREIFELDAYVMQEVRNNYIDHMQSEGLQVGLDNAVGDAGASSTTFSSIMHNAVNQVLLALKADAVVDAAIEAHKRGEKPIIAIANTNGSIIEEYARDAGLEFDDPIDVPFNEILKRYVERLRRITKKGEDGKKT